MSQDVVLVHGIWMPGAVMTYVKQHLERDHGFRGHLFSYSSIRASFDDNAAMLAGFIAGIRADTVHLVGHSLGGVLSLRALALHEKMPAGRVVCLGSPLCGCRAATSLSRLSWGNSMLGKSLVAGVLEQPASQWAAPVTAHREVGVIAGTQGIGMGRLVTAFDEECDGTVAVSETCLPGAKDHLCMRVSHMGMTLSREVVEQAAAFLHRGEFLREA